MSKKDLKEIFVNIISYPILMWISVKTFYLALPIIGFIDNETLISLDSVLWYSSFIGIFYGALFKDIIHLIQNRENINGKEER